MIKFYRRLNTSKKVFFWFGSVVLFFIISLGIAGYILQNRMPSLLKATVKEKTDGVYKLTFDSMKVSLLKGQMKLSNVRLIPDTTIHNQAQKIKKATHLFQIWVEIIDVSGLNVLKFFLHKELKIKSINILKPEITILQMKDTVKEKKSMKLIDQLPKIFQKSNISKLHVTGLSYRSVWVKDRLKDNRGRLSGLNIELTDIDLHTSVNDTSRCFFARNIRVYGKNIAYKTKDGLYSLSVNNFELSTKKKEVEIDTFKIIPAYTEEEFSAKLPFKQDRYDMIYPKIMIKNIDFKYLEMHDRLPVQSMELDQATVHVFADKGMREKKTIAANNFPAFAFRRLQLPLTIDTVRINNTDVYYKELNPKSQQAGTVVFANLTGTLFNVSNDVVQLKKNNWIKGYFETHFLGKPKLSLHLNVDMTSKEGRFNFNGSLAGAPARFYNQLLVPIALAKAEDGYIHGVRFNVHADRYQAQVITELLYNDLKVAILDAESGKIQKKGFLSLFVNWIGIKSDNPSRKEDKPRVANLIYEHPQEKTFFNLMWKSIYTGFKVNLGLPKS